MKEVAAEKKVPFVDLYTPTMAQYAKAKEKLTMNGVHLNEEGNRFVASHRRHPVWQTGDACPARVG
jgi:lysophospholipase L1-like esterase